MTPKREEKLYEIWTLMVHDAAHLEDLAQVLALKSMRMSEAKDAFRTMLMELKVAEEKVVELTIKKGKEHGA